MVCRRWDVYNIHGRYMSTDFIMGDKRANVIHCIARSSSAHCFLGNLEEGSIYALTKFAVVSKEAYSVLRENQFVIEIDGATGVRKVTEDPAQFDRHPFQLTRFEDLQPIGTTHFVDVIGCAIGVGQPNTTTTGRQTVDFHLVNERGREVRVTLWGYLGEELIAKKAAVPGVYAVILTSMCAKYYSGQVCLSSSSATLILDNHDIPALQSFREAASDIDVNRGNNEPIVQSFERKETLLSLLEWGRDPTNEQAVFSGPVQIMGILSRSGWFFLWCGKASCRKGISRQRDCFYCESCSSRVAYPRARFRLQLEVKDATAQECVVCFDETAKKRVHTTANALLDAHNAGGGSNGSCLPSLLENLIGTTPVLEIKSKTHYDHAEYESFNCGKVLDTGVPAETLKVVAEMGSAGQKGCPSSPSGKLKGVLEVPTPAKVNEERKIRKFIQDVEGSAPGDGGSASKGAVKKLRKSYRRVNDSESETEDPASGGAAD